MGEHSGALPGTGNHWGSGFDLATAGGFNNGRQSAKERERWRVCVSVSKQCVLLSRDYCRLFQFGRKREIGIRV